MPVNGMVGRTSVRHAVLFFLGVLLLSSWHLDDSPNANTMSRGALVAALVEDGSFRIDRFHTLTGDIALVDGHYYSEKAPLPALLTVPFQWLFHRVGLIASSDSTHIAPGMLRLGGFLCGSIPFALIVTLCWSRSRRRPCTIHPSLLVAAAFFGSFLFVYSGSFYGHLPAALFSLLAYRSFEQERHLSAGSLAACAVLCEYMLAALPLCWLTLLVVRALRSKGTGWKNPVTFVIGGLPFLILLLIYNDQVFGHPLSMGYDHVVGYAPKDGRIVGMPDPKALWGLTFSAYRGLFLYMPVLLAALVAVFAVRSERNAIKPAIFLPSLLVLLVVSGVGMWWGGWAYGPRHLTTVAVLLAYIALPSLIGRRWAVPATVVPGLAGLLCAFAAKSTAWYALPTEIPAPLSSIIFPAVREGSFTRMQWPVLLGASPGVATVLFLLTFAIVVVGLVRLDRKSANSDAPVPLP